MKRLIILFLLFPTLVFAQASMEFNGTTAMVHVQDNAALDDFAAFSLCIWENHDTSGESNSGRIFQKGDQKWFTVSATNDLRMEVTTTSTHAITRTDSDAFGTNAWHFVCAKYDNGGDRKIDILLNCVEQSYDTEQAATGTMDADDAEYVIGNYQTAIRTFDGQLAYAHIYDKLITTEECMEIMYKPCSIKDSLQLCTLSGIEFDQSGNGWTFTHTSTSDNSDGPTVQLTGGSR